MTQPCTCHIVIFPWTSVITPSVVVVYIQRSKTDPFGRGISITLGATHDALCLVKVMYNTLLSKTGFTGWPPFICENNHYLTQPVFRSYLKKLLQDLNLDPSCYNAHSFRIGAATSAEAAGLTESQIKTLGRWRSDAYHCYIKPMHSQLAHLSKLLIAQGKQNNSKTS